MAQAVLKNVSQGHADVHLFGKQVGSVQLRAGGWFSFRLDPNWQLRPCGCKTREAAAAEVVQALKDEAYTATLARVPCEPSLAQLAGVGVAA